MPGEDLTPWVRDLQSDARTSLFDIAKARRLLEYERGGYNAMTVLGGTPGQAVAFLTERLMAAPLTKGERLPLIGPDLPLNREQLRELRVVEVLEVTGTTEARRLLAGMVERAGGSDLGEDARAALGRLERRASRAAP
jgi:hypothetical protein